MFFKKTEEKMKIMFVDDETYLIRQQWRLSGCLKDHQRVGHEKFTSIERTLKLVKEFNPDIILMDYDLGRGITGISVIKALRESGYKGRFIANCRLDSDKKKLSKETLNANKSPKKLRQLLKGEKDGIQ